MTTTTDIVSEIEGYAQDIRDLLDDFRRAQTDDSDESNDQTMLRATTALDSLDGAVGDLVP